jgi:RNA polymerase sigma factor (sigma-70 family)
MLYKNRKHRSHKKSFGFCKHYICHRFINHIGLFNKISDINIIAGIRNQDEKILNWLYDNYRQSVKKHVLSNSGSLEDASDVFQDTIIVLYSQITEDKLKLTSDLKGYFFGIARNLWNEQLRKKRYTVGLDIDIPDDEDSVEQADPALERIISRVFLQLAPDQQIILKLFSEGFSYEEIASKMDLKNEEYARRKKYLSKEALLVLMKADSEYQEIFLLR